MSGSRVLTLRCIAIALLVSGALAPAVAGGRIKIVLAGDSTVAEGGGWGPGFRASFDPPVEVVNLARNGRSSKSFRDEGLWTPAIAAKPNYILIQFGHNDVPGKGPDRETAAATTYRENMARYVDEARAAGATPILVTSIVRRNLTDAGKVKPDSLVPYVEQIRQLAAAKRVQLIDLYRLTLAQCEHLGTAGCEALDARTADHKLDTTHLGPEGQRSIGAIAARELVRLQPALAAHVHNPATSLAWIADQGDGTYRNPILHADYSDPDVIRAGEDFYMTASSFNAVPGLPILHSRDLVNWKLIGHALREQIPAEVFDKPQHGNGAWAPSIRQHAGEFYIFYGDPDFGIYMTKARHPAGPWSAPLLIKQAHGWIDPCPLWDDDGQAYLVHAMAASRSGIKSVLIVNRMDASGTKLLDDGSIVFDGHGQDETIEGPKFYKRDGEYYIAAPAGGVERGWQVVLRSKNIYGPYDRRVALAQGKTSINGPHQGGWVDTAAGEFWFVHFQDKGAYGRVVHLEPMKWVDGWPVMGNDGAPVASFRKPNVGKSYAIATPPDSDEFNSSGIGLQWQWQANPKPNWAFAAGALGVLRLFAIPAPADARNLWDVPNLLLQKFPAAEFRATAKVSFHPRTDDDQTGLIVMGQDYAYLSLRSQGSTLTISQTICVRADRGDAEKRVASVSLPEGPVYLRVKVAKGAQCSFSYSTNGVEYHAIGDAFSARQGRWIGAKVGIFALGRNPVREYGSADYDWFRVE